MKVTRSQLAKFLPDNESVRVFEELVTVANRAETSAGALQHLPAQVTTTALADSGLFVQLTANRAYRFSFFAAYTATAGTRFTVNGPAGIVFYRSEWALTGASSTIVHATSYLQPAGVNASTLPGGIVQIDGIVIPSESGQLVMQFQSSSPVTIVSGYSRSVLLT